MACVLKNTFRIIYTFNNNAFDRAYRYGMFKKESVLENSENFQIIQKFCHIPSHYGDIFSPDFKTFDVYPTPQNYNVILQTYSDLRDELNRMEYELT